MDASYRLRDGAPDLASYLTLRSAAGLSPKTPEQASLAIGGSLFAVHVVHVSSATVVGMGRLIGDGGWYFHIADMATTPEHQRRGIGAAVLTGLLSYIEEHAPPNPFISLFADEPGRPLYRRFGFRETRPRSIGMARTVT